MSDHIVTLRDLHMEGPEAFVTEMWWKRRRSFPLPKSVVLSPIAQAQVNHGRWIADCPFCNGAEMVDLDKRLFFCGSCLNKGVGGQWLTVAVPIERAAIEAELIKRSGEEHRNWKPGESVAALRAENRQQGVK